MMKRIFVASVLMSALSFGACAGTAITDTQKSLMGEQASLGFGYAGHEGQSGYYLDLNWQFNDYAAVSFGVDSHLNARSFSVLDLGSAYPDFANLNVAEFLKTYGTTMFRPRHNNYTLAATLRYPFPLTKTTMVAPYLEAGATTMSTKDVEFKSISSSGSSSGTGTTTTLTLSFRSLDAFRFGAGIQFGFGDAHRWSLGALGYSNSGDWGDLGIEDSQMGGALRYEYRPAQKLGLVARVETVDQFGDPLVGFGINWVFN